MPKETGDLRNLSLSFWTYHLYFTQAFSWPFFFPFQLFFPFQFYPQVHGQCMYCNMIAFPPAFTMILFLLTLNVTQPYFQMVGRNYYWKEPRRWHKAWRTFPRFVYLIHILSLMCPFSVSWLDAKVTTPTRSLYFFSRVSI